MWNVWEKKTGEYSVLLGKPVGKRQLGIPKSIWESNIKTDLLRNWTGT
jgi:hypothetical protein